MAVTVMEFAEQTGEQLFLVLLDWEKAFDKIHHVKMHDALRRMGVPEKLIFRMLASI